MDRQITFAQAVLEATEQCMASDRSVYVMGLGVTDPKGIFGTTIGLEKKFGSSRVLDMPVSENGMTGVAIGSALIGMRPILTHQRIDFMLLSLDQIINNAAKWHYMFGGKMKVPLVIRLLVGRGWGQGPQHSQNLQSLFAHIPGLKVAAPAIPSDAKGLLVSAIKDDNPVIFIEHRWLHNIIGHVPRELYSIPLAKAKIASKGSDLTIISSSYMTLEALRASEELKKEGISAEVVDLRSIKPLDEMVIFESTARTGRLLVVDGAWPCFGLASEIISKVAENGRILMKCAPQKLCFPDSPTPTSPMLARYFYPIAADIANKVRAMLKISNTKEKNTELDFSAATDVPDKAFRGPF